MTVVDSAGNYGRQLNSTIHCRAALREVKMANTSVHARPGLRLAQHAEHASFEIGGIRAAQGERTAVGLAVGGVIDLAAPLARSTRLHGEHDRHAEKRPALLTGIGIVLVGFWPAGRRIVRLLEPHQIAAQCSAAIDDLHLAFFVTGEPGAEGICGARVRDRICRKLERRRKPDGGYRDTEIHRPPRPTICPGERDHNRDSYHCLA